MSVEILCVSLAVRAEAQRIVGCSVRETAFLRVADGPHAGFGECAPLAGLHRESLADCIEKFAGGVVLVSHDQYFVSRVAKEVWVVEKGKVTRAESFDSYREAQMNKLK